MSLVQKRKKKPVKWIEDRREHFVATTQERDQLWDMEIAVDADAKIIGVRGQLIHETGAYVPWGIVLPWITATAFLHSVMMQEKRGMLKIWNMVLVTLTFTLALFGTFLTRSGIISSVHAFTQGTIGYYFLGFIALVLLAAVCFYKGFYWPGLAAAWTMTLLDTVSLPHGLSWEDKNVQMASLDHAMWFHRPFRADDWLLYDQHPISTGGARGLAGGNIYTSDGTLAISVVQEGLVRVADYP